MGGACSVHGWAHARPALAHPDRLSLTPEGYQRSGQLLFSELLQGYSTERSLAQRR